MSKQISMFIELPLVARGFIRIKPTTISAMNTGNGWPQIRIGARWVPIRLGWEELCKRVGQYDNE